MPASRSPPAARSATRAGVRSRSKVRSRKPCASAARRGAARCSMSGCRPCSPIASGPPFGYSLRQNDLTKMNGEISTSAHLRPMHGQAAEPTPAFQSNWYGNGRKIMVNRWRFLTAGAGALAAPFVLRAGRALGADVTFKLHHFLGPKAPAQTKMLAPWAQQVEQNAGRRVKIELYPSMSLGGAPPQLFGQVRDGVVDIIWTVNGYTASVFPRSEVF